MRKREIKRQMKRKDDHELQADKDLERNGRLLYECICPYTHVERLRKTSNILCHIAGIWPRFEQSIDKEITVF
jgi:hypothetical protein